MNEINGHWIGSLFIIWFIHSQCFIFFLLQKTFRNQWKTTKKRTGINNKSFNLYNWLLKCNWIVSYKSNSKILVIWRKNNLIINKESSNIVVQHLDPVELMKFQFMLSSKRLKKKWKSIRYFFRLKTVNCIECISASLLCDKLLSKWKD